MIASACRAMTRGRERRGGELQRSAVRVVHTNISAEPSTWLSRSSRSPTARISLISRFVDECATSHLFRSSQSFKPISIAHQENVWLAQHRAQEVMAAAHLRSEFFRRVDARVHFATQTRIRVPYRTNDLLEVHVTDDEDVDVAARLELVSTADP